MKDRLLGQLFSVLTYLFPNGKRRNNTFVVGDIEGNAGKSLVVELEGHRQGLWIDFASPDNDRGDIIDLWAKAHGRETRRDFNDVMESIHRWLALPDRPKTKAAPYRDELLGGHSQRWDYFNEENTLVACVFRYDTPKGKSFRLWDARNRKYQAPSPRILYNLPQVITSEVVVLVEGEKCADSLIELGIVATTAMNGANAPIDKTDWNPLKNKKVIIWPDNDESGKKFAERVEAELYRVGATAVSIVTIPQGKPERWDAADAIKDDNDVGALIAEALAAQEISRIEGLIPASDWIGEAPQREWIIPDWLPRGYVTALYGDGGVGKSLLAQQLVTSLVSGHPWMDIEVTPCRVYALMCEDDGDELWRRQQYINHAYDLPMHALKTVKFVSRVGMDNTLMAYDKPDAQGELTPFFSELLRDIRLFNADVVVLDTAADLFGGNENNRGHVRQFVQNACARIARDTGGAVLLCAHPSDSGISRGTGTGGSTAWNNTVRSRWYLSFLHGDDINPGQRLLSRKKSNYSASKADITMDWQDGALVRIYPEVDDEDETTSADASNDSALSARQKDREALVLELIRSESLKGKLYTAWGFASRFKQYKSLGKERSLKYLVSDLCARHELAYVKDGRPYGLATPKKGHGFLCVPDMPFLMTLRDAKNQKFEPVSVPIKATHYADRYTGEVMPASAITSSLPIHQVKQEGSEL